MPHATTRRRVVRVAVDADGVHARPARPDTLAVEEPLEIRLGTTGEPAPFTVTMRTPGHDLELALGFLVAEGVVRSPADVLGARHCPDASRDADGEPTYNVVEVVLAAGVAAPEAARHRHVSSACGICGTETIEAVRARSAFDVSTDDVRISPEVLAGLPDRLRTAQRVFATTGGLHAAGLFTPAGDLVTVREDVGRHNAVDKVVGASLEAGRVPLAGHVLQVSGRASFELVQKAWTAGCPVLAAVSAPSSLAVELAEEAGMTLVGFSRGGTFNVYTRPDRLGL
ncbi:formate dehydrogenase accessory sulfurtransferase FdhD [Kineosporia sp. R_H_3]|uniref:formate dehydrogenase accessory sulfurtransferase FdhD n=1 Tax=Kineosporia sp. R_H_3 TaxID=1961848 RepID=UPI000B4B472E|nr:formate dehydrogenase accessory sulfurtransferase FdhD [Kineosporia sp. R_H_3]